MSLIHSIVRQLHCFSKVAKYWLFAIFLYANGIPAEVAHLCYASTGSACEATIIETNDGKPRKKSRVPHRNTKALKNTRDINFLCSRFC